MLILVGLGNPGSGYAANRHNVGFMALDAIVARYRFAKARRRFHGLAADGEIAGTKVLALQPHTYMNDSGRAVAAAAAYYRVPPERIIVLQDEIDLPMGRVRVKRGGGAGGHNGIRSIDAHIGAEYWRVRIGVGRPGVRSLVRHFVLHDISKEERPLIEKVVAAVTEAMPLLVGGDENGFMNKVTVLVNPPKPRQPRATAAKDGQEQDQ